MYQQRKLPTMPRKKKLDGAANPGERQSTRPKVKVQ